MIDWSNAGIKFSSAFVAAQTEMENAVKDGTNPAFRSKYATLSAVLEAVRPPLNKHGIAILQDVGEMTDTGFIEVSTTLLHGESGERITAVMTVRADRQTAQGIGSATTYGRRYLLSAMCGITQEDDDGAGASQQKTPREELAGRLAGAGIFPNDFSKKVFNAPRFCDLAENQIAATLERYEAALSRYRAADAAEREEIPVE